MKSKNKLILYTLPALAVLNLLDAFLSFSLLKAIGSDFKANIVAMKLFQLEPTGTLFLVLKVLFSVLLFIYWKRKISISGVVNALGLFGIGVYLFLICHGLNYLI